MEMEEAFDGTASARSPASPSRHLSAHAAVGMKEASVATPSGGVNVRPLRMLLDDDDETESEDDMEVETPVDPTTEGDDALASGESGGPDSAAPTESPNGTLQIELPADELLLQAALERQSDFADRSIPKQSVWDAVASAVSGSRLMDGHGALTRVVWLQRVWLDERHPAHVALTDSLKTLIVRYRGARASDTSGPKKRSRRVVFDRAGAQRQKQRKLLNQKPQAIMDQQDESEQERSLVFPKFVSLNKKHPAVDSEIEEEVLKIVARYTISLQEAGENNIAAWNEIARASQGRYGSGKDARLRTMWLLKVLKNPKHAEHANITQPMEEMLLELQEQAPLSYRRSKNTRASHVNMRAAGTKASAVVETVTRSDNEALLLELLRTRPFHAGRGRVVAAWACVVVDLHRTPRFRDVFPTAKACVIQMKRLLYAVRHPNPLGSVQLADDPLWKRMKLVDRLVKMQWPRQQSLYTEKHRQLQAQIDRELARRDRGTSLASEGEISADVIMADAAEKEVDEGNPLLCGQKRKSLTDEQLSTVYPVPKTIPRVSQRHRAVQTEEDSDHSDEVVQLQKAVALCRTQSTMQGDLLAEERREHRKELRSVMEMLKQDHETHQREVAAMMELLRGEQASRKHEFAAMMALVTRCIPQQTQ